LQTRFTALRAGFAEGFQRPDLADGVELLA
jgi:hypothetical protein